MRELQNYIERAIVLSESGTVTSDLLPSHVRGLAPIRMARRKSHDLESLCSELVAMGIGEDVDHSNRLHDRIVSLTEKELIQQVLKTCHGVQTKAATRLGINRNTLHKKIDDYGLESEVR